MKMIMVGTMLKRLKAQSLSPTAHRLTLKL